MVSGKTSWKKHSVVQRHGQFKRNLHGREDLSNCRSTVYRLSPAIMHTGAEPLRSIIIIRLLQNVHWKSVEKVTPYTDN